MSRYAGDAGLLLMYTEGEKHICYVVRRCYFFPGWVNRKQNGLFMGSKPKRRVTRMGVTQSTSEVLSGVLKLYKLHATD